MPRVQTIQDAGCPDAPAVDSLLHQDTTGGDLLDHVGDCDRVGVVKVTFCGDAVRGLDPAVELLTGLLGEPRDQFLEAQRLRPRRPAVQAVGETDQDVEVLFDGLAYPWTLHLHHDLMSGAEPADIGLGDRRRPDGIG